TQPVIANRRFPVKQSPSPQGYNRFTGKAALHTCPFGNDIWVRRVKNINLTSIPFHYNQIIGEMGILALCIG
ncbi:MAG: hypothetical protein KJ638_15580, partial [Chloroflexi bacterium]|nr:hypothetical protein [Chloroflexota bacterium]